MTPPAKSGTASGALRPFCLTLLAIASVLSTACLSVSSPVVQTYTETAYRDEVVTESYSENVTKILSTSSGSYELSPLFSWSHPDMSFSGISFMWYYAYAIPQTPAYTDIHLLLRVLDQFQYEKATIRMLDMSRGGHIYAPDPKPQERDPLEVRFNWPWISGKSTTTTWLTEANAKISQAKFLAGRSNLWSKNESPVLEADAGQADQIAVIISGPLNQWNARVSLSAVWTQTVSETYPVTRERQITRQVPYTVERQKTVYQIRQVPFWEAWLQR